MSSTESRAICQSVAPPLGAGIGVFDGAGEQRAHRAAVAVTRVPRSTSEFGGHPSVGAGPLEQRGGDVGAPHRIIEPPAAVSIAGRRAGFGGRRDRRGWSASFVDGAQHRRVVGVEIDAGPAPLREVRLVMGVDRLVAGTEHVGRRDGRIAARTGWVNVDIGWASSRATAACGDRRRALAVERGDGAGRVDGERSVVVAAACTPATPSSPAGAKPSGSMTDSPASRANAVRYTRCARSRSAGGGIGDHRTAVAVPDQHDVRQRQAVEHGADMVGVTVQVGRAGGRTLHDRGGRSA